MSSSASERLDNIRMIRDSAVGIASEGDLSRVRRLRFSDVGFELEGLAAMGDMGWIGLPLPETEGGAGLGMSEFCALTQALGRGLCPEPLIESVFAARCMDGAVRDDIVAGARFVAPAWSKQTFNAGEELVSGEARLAPMAGGANGFLLVVDGGALFVEADSPGLSVTIEKTQDGGNVGTLKMRDVPVLFHTCDASRAIEEATLATAGYLLGVMERAFEITLDYLKTRHQFGKPIGSFQSLQHSAADLRLQIALTQASVGSAAEAWDDGASFDIVRKAVSRAKARAADAAMRITREAIQLHGAIGYTDEADISLFLRKAMTLSNRYGSPSEHRTRHIAANLKSAGVER